MTSQNTISTGLLYRYENIEKINTILIINTSADNIQCIFFQLLLKRKPIFVKEGSNTFFEFANFFSFVTHFFKILSDNNIFENV